MGAGIEGAGTAGAGTAGTRIVGAGIAGARIAALLGALLICGCPPSAAEGAQSAKLHVGLDPARPGAGTTMSFAFTIAAPGGALPAALTRLDVRLPPGMGVDTSGLATCTSAALAHGPRGCSRNARVGAGSVKVQVPLGNVVRPETAALTVFNGPRKGGRTTLVFYAAGRVPIATQLVFVGVIVPGPQGDAIEAAIPLIPTLPNTPDAALTAMTSTLGTRLMTYHRTVGHRRVRFTPKGATLPGRCPAGGFVFSAGFRFNDGSTATAASTVACPRGQGRRQKTG
jgi:hypothetical protein